MGRRFGFLHFIMVKNKQELERRLCELWLGSYHVFASISKFNRKIQSKSNTGCGQINVKQKQKTSEWQDGDGQIKKYYAKAVVGDGNSEPKDISTIRKVKIGAKN